MKPQNFPTFAVWWMMRQGMRTPAMHYRMIRWLESHGGKRRAKLCLQAFRSAGKSTIVGLYCAWRLYENPDLRIIVLAADTPLAKKMVRNVKRIIERHPLTKHMRPATPDQWAGDQFTVNRATELRDPSMMARGITSNITGSRADLIICDDVEVPNTCDSTEKRSDLRERLAEIAFILTPDGAQIFVGTPHTYHSIYADKPRREMGEDAEFLQGFKRLSIPITDRKGQPAWFERYTDAMIADIKLQSGPNKFNSQMMLEPVNIADGRLNPDLLTPYTHDLDYAKEIGTLFLGDTKLVGASAWWDPAFASATGDRSVVAITFHDDAGNIYVHDVAYLVLPAYSNQDEATAQSIQVAALLKTYHIPALTIESNGLGKLLPNILRGVIAKRGGACKVIEHHSSRNKELRILDAFDAPLAAGKLHVHSRIFDTPFMTEMREWRPDSKRGFDDGLDAVAGAIAQTPMRLTRSTIKGRQSWMQPSGRQFEAEW